MLIPSGYSFMQRGVGLIEVMVAVLVLGIGLLGIVNLQNRSLVFNQQAYLYSQATILVADMAERIEANPSAVESYYVNFGGSASSALDCETSDCTAEEIAAWDLNQWLEMVGSSLPQGKAEIRPTSSANEYSITIEMDVERSESNNLDQVGITFRL